MLSLFTIPNENISIVHHDDGKDIEFMNFMLKETKRIPNRKCGNSKIVAIRNVKLGMQYAPLLNLLFSVAIETHTLGTLCH